MNSVPAVQRRRPARDLAVALWLRPRDIFDLYGIPSSTLCDMCKNARGDHRLPSALIPGRNGGKGLRLVKHDDMRAFLERFKG